MKFVASELTFSQASGLKSILDSFMLVIISSAVSPVNGGYPDNKTKILIPSAQTSTFSL